MTVYLDIETTNLYADIGSVIVIGLIVNGEEKFFFVDSPKMEKNVLESFLDFLKEIKNDKIYIWNSDFDIPFLLTRCLKFGLDVSIFNSLKIIDLLKFAREKLRLSSNSLENISLFFGLEKNLELKGKDILMLYQEYLEGKLENRDKIIEHCRDDLQRLKELHQIFKVVSDEWEKSRYLY
ncbi:MAG: ribonuclease H-like domain-containing protein [Candidatus Aenigmatarchaeota archaeon]